MQTLTKDTSLCSMLQQAVLVRVPLVGPGAGGWQGYQADRPRSRLRNSSGSRGSRLSTSRIRRAQHYGYVVSVYPLSLPGALTTHDLQVIADVAGRIADSAHADPGSPDSSGGPGQYGRRVLSDVGDGIGKPFESTRPVLIYKVTTIGSRDSIAFLTGCRAAIPGEGSLCGKLARHGTRRGGHGLRSQLAAVVRTLECRARSACLLRLRYETWQ